MLSSAERRSNLKAEERERAVPSNREEPLPVVRVCSCYYSVEDAHVRSTPNHFCQPLSRRHGPTDLLDGAWCADLV